jgi:hypothetical protein
MEGAMKIANRFLTWIAFAMFITIPLAAFGQWNKKPYTEWSQKEALKVLDDSPWSQKQIFTDTSKNASTTTNSSGQSSTAIAEVINVSFQVRLFTAKPVRQAFSRTIELQQKEKVTGQLAEKLKSLASAEFPDYIIVTVTCDSDKASNMLQQALKLMTSLTTGELKNDTYLLTKNGQRVFIQEYQPPRNDGFGARFVFPRMVDGKPIVTPESGELLFHSDFGGNSRLNSTIPNTSLPNSRDAGQLRGATAFGFTINTRFKVKDMMFDGKLEY